MVKIVKCPTCNADVPWQEGQQWKPFCSERCKLIDLGEWASEGHSIAGESVQVENSLDPDTYNPQIIKPF
ncbi:MAG: DNA gyrase inhibitor YacG [Methylophaga sp.]|nr:MAG: DNA gyrase inhibitor YacG [Methylophaga sp.]